jgi:hypothetical protein
VPDLCQMPSLRGAENCDSAIRQGSSLALDWSLMAELDPIALDQQTAADLCSVSASTIGAATSAGDLIAHYVGTKPLYRRDELIAWVESLPTEARTRRTYR